MYALVIQTIHETRVISCRNLVKVQQVLETICPNLDASCLITGDTDYLFYNSDEGDFEFNLVKLEDATTVITEKNSFV